MVKLCADGEGQARQQRLWPAPLEVIPVTEESTGAVPGEHPNLNLLIWIRRRWRQ